MNAGTAQRITLNLLSTLVMIRLGHDIAAIALLGSPTLVARRLYWRTSR
jgi:hypothetical protein